MTASLFDLTDTSDLSDAVAPKARATAVSANFMQVHGVVQDAAGLVLTLAMVRAALFRKYGVEMKEPTVRAHLNKLVTEGVLHKPTRQTYQNVVVEEVTA